MIAMMFQITSISIVYSTICSGPDQRKHQSSASLTFMRGIHLWPVNSLHRRPVTRKMFEIDDVIMTHRSDLCCLSFLVSCAALKLEQISSQNRRHSTEIVPITRATNNKMSSLQTQPISMDYRQFSNIRHTLVDIKIVNQSDVVGNRPSVLLHSRLNTWLQWIGQRQLQDEMRNIYVLGFGATLRDSTVFFLRNQTQRIIVTAIKVPFFIKLPKD